VNLNVSAKLLTLFLLTVTLFSYQSLNQELSSIPPDENPALQQAMLEHQLQSAHTPEYSYDVVNTLAHSGSAFTEGLLIDHGIIYESAGLYDQSRLQLSDLNDHMLREHALPKQYFAEGIAVLGNHLFQLTYREHTVFVYDRNTLQLLKTFQYPIEGWGLTADGTHLIMSNGMPELYFIDPETFQPAKQLTVTDHNHMPVNSLNELEYINGMIFANVWPTDIIIMIAPQSGLVEGWININKLKPRSCKTADCAANGIAYDAATKQIYVTGKFWPKLYVLKIHSPFTK
jgi:glutaminyl-peptide cyclotransferase